MKVGLVLEGGAMRGMYTIGVLDVFMENNILVDGVIGVSAGALFGVNYCSKQIGRAIRYNKRFNHDKNYMGIIPYLKERNIFNDEYAFHRVPHELDPFDNETYKNSNIPFYAVVTEVTTGEPEYILVEDVFEQMDVIKASGSMPVFSPPVKLGNKEYLDGGISDSIPYQWMLDQGYDKLIVVLTRDITYRKKPMNSAFKLVLNKYPNLVKKLMKRHENYNQAIDHLKELEKQGKVFIVRPSEPITIKKLESDPDKLQQVYDLGRIDAVQALKPLEKFL